MTQENARNGILTILAEEWDASGPPGILDIPELAAQATLALDEVREAVSSLFAEGAVDMDELKSAVYLTPEGYETACGVRKW